MTKNKSTVDKNLQNEVEDLEGQSQQETNDRRAYDRLNRNTDPGGKMLTDKE
jgi:hypothetical protein